MSFFRQRVVDMRGYVPGEQPAVDDIIKLNTNENPYPCSPRVKAAIGRVVQAGLQRYPDPTATQFRQRAADLLNVSPDWIMCGNGSDDILTVVTRACAEPGDVIRFPYPSYVLYPTLAELQGALADPIRFEADWTLGDGFCQPRDRLRLAYLANPNSPSGSVIPPERVLELADSLPCPLLVDEAYVEFAERSCVACVAASNKILVSRSLSKSYALAGLRFGYVVAQPQLIRELNKVKDSYNCDAMSIAGATAAIDDQPWLEANRATILSTRERLADALAKLGFHVTPSQANFLWATNEGLPLEPVYQRLKDNGVLVRYMRFSAWGEGLRISVGTDEQIDTLLALLPTVL